MPPEKDNKGKMENFPIPQVSTEGMSDKEKAKIDPIHRLESTPTKKETNLLALMMKGAGGGLSEEEEKEYAEAMKVVNEERKEARKE